MEVTDREFNPGTRDLFVSYLYLIRRGLYLGIREFAPALSGRMLDFGCGRSPYKPLFNVDQYVGIDVASSGHDDSDKKADVIYDGSVMPFTDGEFDSFICSEVFEHVFDLDHVLHDLARVTRLGAKGIITTPFMWPEHEVPYDFARYSRFGLRHAVEAHGFRVVEELKVCREFQALCQFALVHLFTLTGKLPFILRRPLRAAGCIFLNPIANLQKPYDRKRDAAFFLSHVWLVERV